MARLIWDFLLTQFDTPPSNGQVNYLQEGCLSSLGIMRLVVAIEQKFNIEITDRDLLDPRFKTLDGLTRIILEKLGE